MLCSRVSWKIKNNILSPGDFTPSAFMYEESKTLIARLYTLNLCDGTIGFWFWDFMRENRPKMGLKCAIFKICPKLAKKKVFTWNKCPVHHFWGKLATKSGLRFWIWASEVPFFNTRKRPFSVILGAKKWDFGCSNPKTDTTFCRQLSPKRWNRLLFHMNINFDNRIF